MLGPLNRRSRAGRRRTFCGVAAMVLVVLTMPLVTGAVAHAAPASTAGVTVTGAWHRWNPLAHNNGDGTYTGAYDTSTVPSVNVDETTDLVDQVVHVTWTGFTPSSNDPSYSSVPSPGVSVAAGTTLYPVEVLECRAMVPTSTPLGQLNDTLCYTASTDAPTDGAHGVNNAVRTITRPDGTGEVDFHVETSDTNDLLGCDPTHACSIVVVPNNGGQQPTPGSTGPVACNDHSYDYPQSPDYNPDLTADLNHLGGDCNWADRIVVPIHFAPLASSCPNAAAQFTAVGSPMLQRGLTQLAAGWCREAGSLSFSYNSTSDEYEARNLFLEGGEALTASTDVAFTSQPATTTPGGRAFRYVPIANNAIVIPYYVDDPITGRPITDLRLDARLVAKLLTQSYQPYYFNCEGAANPKVEGRNCAPNVAGNPASIFDDPEFQQLNFRGTHPTRAHFPSLGEAGNNDSVGAFFPTVVSGNSDLTYLLTRWIDDDADARHFLAGEKDEWGMHVNKAYLVKGGQELYPISQFQPLDPGWTHGKGDPNWNSQGFQSTWNPVSGLQNVTTYLVAGRSSTQITNPGVCSVVQPANACQLNPSLPVSYPRVAAEPIGTRDLWSVMDNIDAAAYKYPTAELVNSSGVAVGPTNEAMTSAVSHMQTNADGVTSYVAPATEAATDYPLTVVDYAMIPTCDTLTQAKGDGIRTFLDDVANSQTYGLTPGTLSPGMVRLTSAQLKQVRAVAGTLNCPAQKSAPPGSTAASGTQSSGSSSSSSASSNLASSKSASHSAAGKPLAVAATSSKPFVKHVGFKPAAQNGPFSLMMPSLLVTGFALLALGPLTWLLAGTRRGQLVVARLSTLRFW